MSEQDLHDELERYEDDWPSVAGPPKSNWVKTMARKLHRALMDEARAIGLNELSS